MKLLLLGGKFAQINKIRTLSLQSLGSMIVAQVARYWPGLLEQKDEIDHCGRSQGFPGILMIMMKGRILVLLLFTYFIIPKHSSLEIQL